MQPNHLPEIILEELETCGFDWRVENGGRHAKVFVANRMVGILPFSKKARHGASNSRSNLNLRAAIRRVVRELLCASAPPSEP